MPRSLSAWENQPVSELPVLEGHFRRYADLPPEVIIKEVLLTQGLATGPGLPGNSVYVPKMLRLEGGPFHLRRTILRLVVDEASPYLLQTATQGDDGAIADTPQLIVRYPGESARLVVVDRASGELIAPAWFFPENPPHAHRVFPDGVPYIDVISPGGEVTAIDCCQLGYPQVACRFCSVNELPRRGESGATAKGPEQLARAVAEVFLEPDWSPRERPVALCLTGGSIVETVGGLSEEEFYLRYVRAIRDRIGHAVPILLDMFPKSLEVEKQFQKAGVDARLSNLEVWDRRLFEAFCPGKAQTVGWDEWIRRILDQVYVYGWSGVLPGLVIGLEMMMPHGFAHVGEAVASTVQGMRFLAGHGAVPRPVHLRADRSSSLRGSAMPPVELFLEVDRAWYDLFLQYGQDEPIGLLLGPGRSRYPDSAAFDVGRGAALSDRDRGISSVTHGSKGS